MFRSSILTICLFLFIQVNVHSVSNDDESKLDHKLIGNERGFAMDTLFAGCINHYNITSKIKRLHVQIFDRGAPDEHQYSMCYINE